MNKTQSNTLRSPWRKNLSTVEPLTLRTARYALQIHARNPQRRVRLRDDDFLGALWSLSVPLIEPAVLDTLRTYWMRAENEREAEDDIDFDDSEYPDFYRGRKIRRQKTGTLLDGAPGERMRSYLIARFSAIPDNLLAKLATADSQLPTHPTVSVLADCAGLDTVDQRILDFVEKRETVNHFKVFLRESVCEGMRDNVLCLEAALDVPAADIKRRLTRSSPLALLGLVKRTQCPCDLEDFLRAGDLLEDLLTLEPSTSEALLGVLAEPIASLECTLEAFPHLARDASRLQAVMLKAARDHVQGVNALFYGPPGSGKTQFASAIAHATGLQGYQVRSADEDGDGLSRGGRLGACQLVLRLLKGRSDCMIVFDEVEDVFSSAENGLLAFFGMRKRTGKDKGWMNRLLEDNPLPMIWITNDAESMDPAFLRRFLLPVAFSTPPRRVRRQMIERHLGETTVTREVLDELAADPVLAPAQYGAARRLLDLHPEGEATTVVREGVAATRRVLYGSAGPRLRSSATEFDVAFLNLAGGVPPARLGDMLARRGRGSLCFFGPPGTGKTEFAHVLADALDRELVAQASSDLVSPYVGETERNLARLFAEIDVENSVLLLDEVDSLLRTRETARHSWEATMVNELLQQMERFNGILIATTNMIGQLDPAAMRRFDFKLQFRPLDQTQRRTLFAREALGHKASINDIPAALRLRSGCAWTPSTCSRRVILPMSCGSGTCSVSNWLQRSFCNA